jgi:hypothetical protein
MFIYIVFISLGVGNGAVEPPPVCTLQLEAGVAVLKSLRVTLPTGIMAGSELPHHYVERVISAQKARTLSGPFSRLWNNSEAYRFSISADARLDSFIFFSWQDRQSPYR